MRPLKIIITGFCSYGKTTEIDLEQLGTSGLYLITGKTGSGKTTLFDAITYALYGEPSGNNRETSMLRSSFAGPDLPTEVELFFELRGEKYHIKRNPSYERQAKRGEGTTVEAANAVLTLPDGKILEGPKTVDKKIIELMGIDRTQFSQIVMLAQGDFQKLLTEGTIVRQEIFRKLFKTDNYQKLQKKLTEKQKELNLQVSNISRDLTLYFQNTQCDYDSVNNAELSRAKETEMAWSDKIELIEFIIEEDRKNQKRLEKEDSENQKELDEVVIQLNEAQEIKNTQNALKLKKKEIENAHTAAENYKTALEIAENKLKTNPEKERKAALINNDLEKYDLVDNLKKQMDGLQKEIDSENKKLGLCEEKIESKNRLLEELNSELKGLEAEGDKSAELTIKENQLNAKKQNIIELQTQLKNYSESLAELKKAQEEYAEESSKAMLLQQEYLAKNKLFLDGQAGVLALTLKDDEPCPVCGSVHHPSPAKKMESVPTEKELNQFKDKADVQNQLAEEKSRTASLLNGKTESQLSEIEKNRKLLFPEIEMKDLDRTVVQALNAITYDLNELKDEIDLNEKRRKRKGELTEKLPVVQEELKKLNEEAVHTGTEISVKETSMKHLTSQLEDAAGKLQFAGKELALKEIEKLEGEITAVKTSYDEAQESFHNAEMKIRELQGAARELEERLKNVRSVDEDKLNQVKIKLETEDSGIAAKLKQLFARIQANESALEKIRPYSEELIEKQNRLQLLMELANTANGNLGQKKAKVMLETYVQMHYFDRIIAHANKRFMIMSGGQYELVRKKEADNAQSQTGLELNVIDHYKGKERDVKSLSGGESFEASLSLALGLSDEISENAGGIRIDSMFVDEGFGTLDSDTLQKAYNALVSVTEGNRLVGIISHVDYLKEKIDRQVVITKEPESGSSVTIKL